MDVDVLYIWREGWMLKSVQDMLDKQATEPRLALAVDQASKDQVDAAQLVIWDGEALRLGRVHRERHPHANQVVLVDSMLPGFAVTHTIEAARAIGATVLMWPREERYRRQSPTGDRLSDLISLAQLRQPSTLVTA